MSKNNTTNEVGEMQGKTPYTDWMTPEARKMLRRLAKADGHTMSEYLERTIRRTYDRQFGGAKLIGKAALQTRATKATA